MTTGKKINNMQEKAMKNQFLTIFKQQSTHILTKDIVLCQNSTDSGKKGFMFVEWLICWKIWCGLSFSLNSKKNNHQILTVNSS